jgi:hypothetical protein
MTQSIDFERLGPRFGRESVGLIWPVLFDTKR